MIRQSRLGRLARRGATIPAIAALLAVVSATPLAAKNDTLAKTVVGDFATYCLDIASDPDDVRSAARAAGLARVPDDKLAMVMPVPGEAWVTWADSTTSTTAFLTLNSEGACGVRFWGVPVADVRARIEETLTLLGPDARQDGDMNQWLYAVSHRGQIGTLFLVEHAGQDGKPGWLTMISVEVMERHGQHRAARRVREQFEPAKALAMDFSELCLDAAGDAKAVDAAARGLGWAPVPEERARTVLKSPGLAWESTGRPFGAVLELRGDGSCRIDFQGVVVADVPQLLGDTMELRPLDEGQRSGSRALQFATRHRGRIGYMMIMEYAGRNGQVGAMKYVPIEVIERKGDQDVVRWLRQ